MTTVVRTPDPTRCPDCHAALTGPTACAACGLRLQGPAAQRLWELDIELLRLDGTRAALLHERTGLLAQLRGSGPAAAVRPAGAPPLDAPVPGGHVLHRPAAPEWTPKRVQNALLSLGGLLLAVAALVFAAVTYERLGAGGRAAVLVLLTVLAASAAPLALRRGLAATAETVTGLALVLAALDAYGLRTLGVADGTSALAYAAGSAAVIATAVGAYAWFVPVRLAGAAAVVVAQLPVPLLLADAAASGTGAALCLAGLAGADLAALALLRGRTGRHVTTVIAASAGTATALGLLIAVAAHDRGRPGLAALALLAHAGVLVAAGALTSDRTVRTLLWAAPVPALATAASYLAEPELTEVQRPLVLAAVGVLAVQAAALMPVRHRTGPVLGALAVAAAAVAAVADSALSGLLLPLTWLVEPWTLAAGASAREAVGTTGAWDGTVVTTVVLACAAVAAGTAGLALHRVRESLVPAAALVTATAVLLPLGLALSYPAALALLLVLAAGLLAAGSVVLPRALGAALAGGGGVVVLLAAAWSLADQEATLVVLAVSALLVAGLASRPLHAVVTAGATGLASGLAIGELAAAGAARDLADDQVGGLLLVAVAVLLALAAVLDPVRSRATEVVAVGTGALAVCLAVRDPGWLSWVLAGLALLALATALRPDRRAAAAVGGLLLSVSSWVRLADAGVTAPEPYVLPLAVVGLALGHLRRRAVPGTRSWAAYGPGLSVLLLPSLLASFDDDALTRPLLLGAAALAVLLLGARERLQAPLVVGGGVLAVDALRLVAPVAAALPRWSTIGLAGTLLVAIGATYEKRLQDVARARAAYDALS